MPAPPPSPARPPRLAPRRLLPLLLLAMLALGWGLVWRAADRSILTRVPVLDEAYYLRQGAAIAGGQLLPDEPFVLSPLYPYLVAVAGGGRAFDERGVRMGSPPRGLRALQALAWLAIVLLLRRAARRLLPGPRWLAWLPPLLFALYAPAAVFATTALLEIPLTLAVLAALSLLPEPGPPPTAASGRAGVGAGTGASGSSGASAGAGAGGKAGSGQGSAAARFWARPWLRPVATGLLIGLASLLRPIAVLLLGVVWLAWRAAAPAGGGARRDGRPGEAGGRTAGRRAAGLAPTAVAVATALAVLAPVVAHNSAKAGRLVGVSANGGLNLYIGLGQGATGFFRTFAGLNFDADPAGVAFLSSRLGRPVAGPAEADRLWLGETLAWVRDHPLASAALWAKKVWLHFAAWEIDQVTPLAAWRRDVPLLRALALPYGALAAAALVGLALVGRRRPWRPWSAALLLLVAGQSLFFVVTRYRLVLVPLLCLLAGAAVAEARARRGRARLAAGGLALAAALAVWPWGLRDVQATWRAASLSNEATRWERLGGTEDLARAEALLRQAIAVDPRQVQAWQRLARVQQSSGRTAEAERTLADGALRADLPYLLQKDLINLYMQQERFDEALPRLDQYLRERPRDGDALHALAIALAGTGRLGAALDAAARLMAEAPGDPRGFIDRGVLLARGDRPAEARAVFAEGLRRFPDNAALRHNLELVSGAAGGK